MEVFKNWKSKFKKDKRVNSTRLPYWYLDMVTNQHQIRHKNLN